MASFVKRPRPKCRDPPDAPTSNWLSEVFGNWFQRALLLLKHKAGAPAKGDMRLHTHPNSRVGNIGERIAGHLDAIRTLFKPGAVITLIVRPGDAGDGDHSRDMILTSDKLPKVIEAIQYNMTASTTQHAEVQADD